VIVRSYCHSYHLGGAHYRSMDAAGAPVSPLPPQIQNNNNC